MPLVLACCWNNFVRNQHFTFCQAEGQPKSELICGHSTISHSGGWVHCKLCYIILLRITGGEIWAPVVVFHWYRLEGISKVGHTNLHASSASKRSILELLECGFCTLAKSMSQRLYPKHRAAPGPPSSTRETFSHLIHHLLGWGSKSW